MTSSPGSIAASIAAIIASVAPHETVTSVSGSTARPHAADCLRATAWRSCGAPHVVAYWLKPSRSAAAAASSIRASVLKSGNPWAKLTARSGPLICMFSRVISRMTDSVKLWAFIERWLMPRIGALQVEVRARARVAALGFVEAALPPPAHVARPPRLGKKLEDVRAAEQPDHLAVADHRYTADPLPDQQSRGLVDAGVLGDRDDTRAHDVARDLALLREHVGLGDDADHVSLRRHDRRAGDALGRKRRRDLIERLVLVERDHVPRHHLFDRDHQCRSSVATVSRFALPPVRIKPVRPLGSFPERCAASGRAPVGSSARCSRDQATRTADAISSSVTVTISSTSRLVNMVSKLRSPIEVVRTPSAMVVGAEASDWMLPVFQLR